MSDYIKIADLNTWLCRICDDIDYDGVEYVLSRMDEIPAADVRENVHAHYFAEFDGYSDGYPVYDMWYCSNCGCYFEEWDEKPTYKFCPYCGAIMDGGDKE